MIYLITGIPGSGKTLYAVSTLIPSLLKDSFVQDDGTVIKRRLVVDGIPGLSLEHEILSETLVNEKSITVKDGGSGVGNWWDWCQPGDVIVVDECQRLWRPRSLGSKPPQMVTELELHRHRGVDFVIITQSPMLIDQNVRRLVGRHQHVRRLFGMKRALIYDWDGCQSDVHRVAAANKSMWSYPVGAFDQYKSAQLHTKQKQKFPVWVALPIAAVIAGVVVAPYAYSALSGSMTGRGVQSAKASPPKPEPVAAVPSVPASAPVVAEPDTTSPVPAGQPRSVFAGCVRSASSCRCFDTSGVMVEPPSGTCGDLFGVYRQPASIPAWVPSSSDPVAESARAEHDGAVLASMGKPRNAGSM